MKKYTGILFAVFFLVTGFAAKVNAQTNKKANEDTEKWRYELEVVATGTEGTYLVKVWSYSKKPVVATEQSKKNAVHGIIFKGYAGKRGMDGAPPLITDANAEQDKKAFFDDFFSDGGKYMKFVNLSTDGAVAAEDRMKIGKEYKIGVIVSVNVDQLKRNLREAGLIRGLSSGF